MIKSLDELVSETLVNDSLEYGNINTDPYKELLKFKYGIDIPKEVEKTSDESVLLDSSHPMYEFQFDDSVYGYEFVDANE